MLISIQFIKFRELEGSSETFVSLRVVVLKGYLKLDRFGEVSLLTLQSFAFDLLILSSRKFQKLRSRMRQKFVT